MCYSIKHFSLFIVISLILISCGTLQRGKIKYHKANNHSTQLSIPKEKIRILNDKEKIEAANSSVRSENMLMNGMSEHKVVIESKGQDLPCDTLLLRNGKVIAGLVQSINDTYIVYKMCDEQVGDDYFIHADLVKSIRKANGSVTNLNLEVKPVASQSTVEDDTGPSDKFAKAVNRLGELAFIPVVGWVFAVLAFILGSIALYKIKHYPAEYKGANTAWTGIILGIVALVLGILIAALIFTSMGIL